MRSQKDRWSNWSGSVTADPEHIAYPGSIGEIVELVHKCRAEGRYIRIVGTGHSFTAVAASSQVLVSLDKLQGLVNVNHEEQTAVVWGGTKLKLLGQLLYSESLAQENMGDIDAQSIAGAVSTGTHGTGLKLGSLSTQVIGFTIVNGLGEVLECSEQSHPELFKALQVSLGTLGIIVQVKLRLRKSYILACESKRIKLSDCLGQLKDLAENNRHFEFFWFPYAQTCQVKLTNEAAYMTKASPIRDYINESLLENKLFGCLSSLCRAFPPLSATVSRISASSVPVSTKASYSHQVFATQRLVKFNEMEYSIPVEAMEDTINEMRSAMNREKFHVHFPIECRFAAGDDIWLSPSYGRDSGYIAVHMYRGMPYERYFEVMEQILQSQGGRPHWGKMHTLKAAQLKELYPMWQQFAQVRAQMDPEKLFLSSYMRELIIG
ncbi:D-arabinono-1,4-lactone oxidase [Paenibacillus sp. GXUN7292]|uniref:D-arabinono-1,4-lactone oxidase n=1 Tax=Paenibacillus sp. GXUN7292 TaxID=3422499 RepID=UPI003D7D49D0